MRKKRGSLKEDLFKLPAIEVYKIVLVGDEIKNFPAGFWTRPEAEENAIECMKYLFEEILNYSIEDIKKKFDRDLFAKYRLGGMTSRVFKQNMYNAINVAYPGKIHPWELSFKSFGMWDKEEDRIKAIKWLVEDKLNMTDEDIKEKFTLKLLRDNGLGGLAAKFSCVPYKAIELTYPGRFKPWEFKMSPGGVWDSDENKLEAIKWLVEEKLKFNDDDIKRYFSAKLISENGLRGLLKNFKSSPYLLLDFAYPGRFKPWELSQSPNNTWGSNEIKVEAIKWLIEERLKFSDDDIRHKLSNKVFKENGLSGLLYQFGNSYYAAIDFAYPGRFKREEFKGLKKVV